MERVKHILGILYKFGVSELLILISYFLLLNNYLGNPERTIVGDGVGYYDYLVSNFIEHDFNRKDLDSETKEFERIRNTGAYAEYKGKRVNKYSYGTALFQMPFFLVTYYTIEKEEISGLEPEFQRSIFHAAIFYLFFALVFIRLYCRSIGIQEIPIFIAQVFLVLATSATFAASFGASGSHIYSMFAIAGFIYFTRQYFVKLKTKYFLYACVFIGLILVLRQINVLVLLFLPFIAGSWPIFKEGMKSLFKPWWRFGLGILIIFIIGVVQLILWYQQTGDFIVYSYQGEYFLFENPHMREVLFSYKRGAFIYAPILFVSCFGLITLLLKKSYFQVIGWLGAFLVFTYVISCWWVWTYGSSYGHRVFIDIYPFIIVLLAMMLNSFKRIIQVIFFIIFLPLIYMNAIQIYQYNNFILDWHEMNQEKYWKIFLKTDDKYKGIYFKEAAKLEQLVLIKRIHVGSGKLEGGKLKDVFSQIDSSKLEIVDYIKISFENDFKQESNSKIVFIMVDFETCENILWMHRPHVHFAIDDFNTQQKGYYLFRVNLDSMSNPRKYLIQIESDEYFQEFENMEIEFLSWVR